MDHRLSPRRGFSLVELLTVLVLGLGLVAGLLSLFRAHAAVVRRQSQAADVQQSLRIARHELARVSRMAGRGGLPAAVSDGAAVTVRNNVGAGSRIGGAGTPGVVPGTDVLVVRGVLEGSILDVAAAAGDRDSGFGSITLRRHGDTGAEQELEPLAAAVRETPGEALLLSGGPGSARCAVVELVGASGSPDEDGRLAELALEFRAGGSVLADGYRDLSQACEPVESRRIRRAGLLEEQRFYLRRDDGPPGAGARHQLARVRFYPGSNRVHPSSPRAGVAMVDHALDLQVALGTDLDGDGSILEGAGEGRLSDEWLFNDPRDRAADESWSGRRVALVRLTLLLRAARPTRGHTAPSLARLEDRDYGDNGGVADLESRLFQRVRATATVRPRGR